MKVARNLFQDIANAVVSLGLFAPAAVQGGIMTLARVRSACLVACICALSFAVPASADPFGGYWAIIGPSVDYNSTTDVFSISGPVVTHFLALPGGSFADDASGFQTLIMNVDQNGHSTGGVFSIVGTVPSLGINTPRVLLAANITGISISSVGSFGDPLHGYTTSFVPDIRMDTLYSDPAFGLWGQQMQFQGRVFIDPLPIPLNDQTLFTQSWHGQGPIDYWDLQAFTVPEPSPLALLFVGLAGLGFSRRRKFGYN